MPMNMGIHHKPMGHDHSAFLDSRLRGNDRGMVFLQITPELIYAKLMGLSEFNARC